MRSPPGYTGVKSQKLKHQRIVEHLLSVVYSHLKHDDFGDLMINITCYFDRGKKAS